MNFFKFMGQNLTSNQSFPYNVGNVVTGYVGRSVWTLHQGTKKDDGSAVSIFNFDVKKNPSKLEVAKNGFKRAKTIRHPNFIKYLDGMENESNIYIVTEPVQPLDEQIEDIRSFENAISWGIYQVTKGLAFLNNDCNLTHGNIQVSSIFVTKSGDWKIGGLDFVSDVKDIGNSILKNHHDLIPSKYKPPEITKSQWSQISSSPPNSIDSWMLGCLIYECYSGSLTAAEDIRNINEVPKILHGGYQKLFSVKTESRLNPNKLLESQYFQNVFVETCVFLENITLKDTFEKEQFFKKIDQYIEKIPKNICKFKILPHLVTAFDLGPVNPKLLGTLLKIGSSLSTDEYNNKIVPSVVKWFACDDRALRINLLENLEFYIQHLNENTVNEQIFPNVVNGFNDNPTLKEITIKSMLLFAPKLSEKTMIQLLKYLAALQKDQQPGIRTNTTICLGRITEYMSDQTRKRVLIPAFSTALKDPFIPSQNAAIQAFMFTQNYYTIEEMAVRIIPELTRCLISPDKSIRTASFQAVNLFLQKIEKNIDNVYSSGGNPAESTGSQQSPAPSQQTQSGDSMLGWAVGMTKKLYSGENSPATTGSMNSNPNSTPTPTSNSTSPPSNNNSNQKSQSNQNSTNSSLNSSSSSSINKPSPKSTTSLHSNKPSKVVNDGWGDDDSYDIPEPTTKKQTPKYSNDNDNDDDEENDDSYKEYNKYKEDLPRLSTPSKPSSSTPTSNSGNKPMTLTSKKPTKISNWDEGWD
ncbi:hypothetical protein DICPUDRAFT_55347 [Dictyostelium purpureum]|uniref:Protein kinase domain-containing protein n=1 Tax=Dictyostelium purpureum TaxID=5786 RepID=F0ZLP5_DICPU|nr:uncharacterized protein DICPUDRAFT_55347 [Dictyostelium purpureum]EGC35135.1 hypothetical protein DICPUDRAFT_55347 [Dictyostelium purpureum]|eukprot:XP_003288328.1 hypothetical protein DICPUDRAFT_55347 [Dictyostelium purpureum]